ALGDLHTVPGGRSGADGVEHLFGDFFGGAPDVHRHAGRLRLQGDAVPAPDDVLHGSLQIGAQLGGLGIELVDEPDVELGTVAADQVHFGGQPGQGGQVA